MICTLEKTLKKRNMTYKKIISKGKAAVKISDFELHDRDNSVHNIMYIYKDNILAAIGCVHIRLCAC